MESARLGSGESFFTVPTARSTFRAVIYRHRKAAADRWEGLALMSVFRCTLASVDLLEPTLADIDSSRSAIHRIN
jgi:hypothetical protein